MPQIPLIPFLLLFLLTACGPVSLLTTAAPLLSASHPNRTYPHGSALRTDSYNVPGVWQVTKVASLIGPTLAIFIYDKTRDAYERYEPFVSAALLDFVQSLHAAAQSPYSTHPVIWLSSMPKSHPNPHVTSISNEIIRLTNVRLRERAVVSRIQMDDDQYEFTKAMSASDVRNTALQVMSAVLYNGSGQYLQPQDKAAVHALIASSVY